ncbi:nicotinate mononucleotide-dependent phosphoribosyltransferase CobT [Halovivax limisalsi]|uniref:nicotinate mononucleotide-dependent phosphoribosyltransferase CobT n=1 Tax=Halovivax limisalsi TaxID=1453760 RepID=UPI001FFC5B55|nr:TIGR00303 family protein [Halovivax limisalsi]
MRLILAAGTTETARVDGISAAGATPSLAMYTPAADAEILVYGEPVASPVTPVSPSGAVTPAAVTRAVRDVRDFPVTIVDAGLAVDTAAPTVDLGVDPGADLRSEGAVPDAAEIFDRARRYGAAIPDDELVIGETIPGGTTTALGALRALGEPFGVSSSLASNPLERKRAVVRKGLSASGLEPGDCEGAPLAAIEAVGDPVQAVVAGIAAGGLASGTDVTLAGGTQQLAIAALLRRAGVDGALTIATTSFVADDRGDELSNAANRFDCDLVVADPGFDAGEHVAMARYCAGEVKEGVAMGAALSLVNERDLPAVRERFVGLCDRLGVDESAGEELAPPESPSEVS